MEKKVRGRLNLVIRLPTQLIDCTNCSRVVFLNWFKCDSCRMCSDWYSLLFCYRLVLFGLVHRGVKVFFTFMQIMFWRPLKTDHFRKAVCGYFHNSASICCMKFDASKMKCNTLLLCRVSYHKLRAVPLFWCYYRGFPKVVHIIT